MDVSQTAFDRELMVRAVFPEDVFGRSPSAQESLPTRERTRSDVGECEMPIKLTRLAASDSMPFALFELVPTGA